MATYAVFGDIHPSMCVRIEDAELKTIATKLALGIKPENIRIEGKVFDGSRDLDVADCVETPKGYYSVINKHGNLCLTEEEIPW